MGLCPVSWSLVTSNPSKASALPCLGPSLRQSLWGPQKGVPRQKPLFCTLPQGLYSCSRRPCQSSKTKRPPGKHQREWNVPGFSIRFYWPQVEGAAELTQVLQILI